MVKQAQNRGRGSSVVMLFRFNRHRGCAAKLQHTMQQRQYAKMNCFVTLQKITEDQNKPLKI